VYAVVNSAKVAKIYKETVAQHQRLKLEVMIRKRDPELGKVAAWPEALAFNSKRQAVGFIMARIEGHQPIHMLYGPTHRKTHFPRATWLFLVHAARNIAHCFDAVHRQGHVIGDVNYGNVVVSTDDALVRLIDCDSFQIADGGKQFPCEVGVPHFTPPELQGKPFRNLRRTPNHDNFGLALLCFHLLFMGRHPFAGVYPGAYQPLEEAIRQFRFAFGSRATSMGLRPPPHAAGLDLIPKDVGQLFEHAFSPDSVIGRARPSGADWVRALDAIRAATGRCAKQPSHFYWLQRGTCPWCVIEQNGGPVLFILWTPQSTTLGSDFNLAAAWAAISSMEGPGIASEPPLPTAAPHLTGKPLPAALARRRMIRLVSRSVGVLAAAVLGLTIHPLAGIVVFILAFAFTAADSEEAAERQRRGQTRDLHLQRMKDLCQQWSERGSDRRFREAFATLEGTRSHYTRFDSDFQAELKTLHERRRDAQLRRHLERFAIDEAGIKGIGPGRAATLASFGIETAADVGAGSLDPVPGFGPALTKRLVGWRAGLTLHFVFDANEGIHPQDLADLKQRYAARRTELERALQEGAALLQRIRTETLQYRQNTTPLANQFRAELAQAEADLAV
jgi:DNA-binding helix-hairpin-helix protein with protein kinase domain